MLEKVIAFFVCGIIATLVVLVMGGSGITSAVSGLLAGTIAIQLLKYLNGDFDKKPHRPQ